jgi:hypothetical protein
MQQLTLDFALPPESVITLAIPFTADLKRALITHRSYWIPGSWHLRMVYTNAIPFHDPSQESNRAG